MNATQSEEKCGQLEIPVEKGASGTRLEVALEVQSPGTIREGGC